MKMTDLLGDMDSMDLDKLLQDLVYALDDARMEDPGDTLNEVADSMAISLLTSAIDQMDVIALTFKDAHKKACVARNLASKLDESSDKKMQACSVLISGYETMLANHNKTMDQLLTDMQNAMEELNI